MTTKKPTLEDLNLDNTRIVVERTVGTKRIIVKSNRANISQSTRIARYTSLSNLVDIMYYHRLYVPNRQNFDDLRETKGLRRYREDIPQIRSFASHNSVLWWNSIENDRRRFLRTCVSCWTMGTVNGDKLDENYLMWKSYAKGNVSCRMETTLGQLLDSITDIPEDIIIEDVVYGDSCQLNNNESLLFHKSRFYALEQELRLVVLSNNAKGTHLTLNVDNLFGNNVDTFKVTLSPFAPPSWYYFLLNGLLDFQKKHKGFIVCQSDILEYKCLTPEDGKALEIFKDYK